MILSFFVLLILVVIGAAIALRTPIPDAVFWAAIGFLAAYVPQLPVIRFDPQIALLFFLPPLVYASAVDLPWREFRENLRAIGTLAIGLVIATAALVAAIVHAFAGVPWAGAAVLGAIVSPTDPVAASAVARRVGMPRRLIAILEGEGLVNDAMALTIFGIALQAVQTNSFSVSSAVLRFAAIAIGEPVYGWLIGVLITRLRSRVTDARIEIAISLLTPFIAYLPPQMLGGSGILATVACGMYVGERRPELMPAGTRLHAASFWQMIVFLLNGALFVVAGMELHRAVYSAENDGGVVRLGLAVAGGIILIRFGWFAMSWFVFVALRRILRHERHPTPRRHLGILAWSAIRGPISLAAALSIPAAAATKAFPKNPQLGLYVAAFVVIATLLPQGLTLPALVRRFHVDQDSRREAEQSEADEKFAADEAIAAGLQHLEELERSRKISPITAARLRRYYENVHTLAGSPELYPIIAELIDVERARILELRNQGRMSDHTLARLERRLDLRRTAWAD
jgi:CPA1 family monovalent cation:H+ antiporter